MDCIATRIPYRQAGAFSRIVLDLIDQADTLKPFYAHPVSLQGIQSAIAARKQFKQERDVLVQVLRKQYVGVETTDKVKANIEALLAAESFTITTAHQNNLFSGPLYFIYKIVHAIRLADHLKETLTGHQFIPVFYIGTEDADLDELNHIYLGGEKLVWETKQTGAVGRMRIDKSLVSLIGRMEGQLTVLPHGAEIISLLKDFYKEGTTIQDATFRFVNHLFAEYGLVVLLPDNAELKKQMIPVFEDDLLNQTASGIVEQTTERLKGLGYRVQAHPREINLFYLRDDRRERIVRQGTKYKAQGTSFEWTGEEIIKELNDHPEHFSPNVILRGIYQETILPNLAFIGGGGETAYWLQLKDLSDHYKVPFPVLVLRNSFMILEEKWRTAISKLGFTTEEFFLPEEELLNKLVTRESRNATRLNGSLTEVEKLYESFKQQASAVDSTLEKHVDALKLKTVHRLQELEKKMLRAEKRKFSDQQRKIHTIKEHLFPDKGLQERKDNLSYYYAKWGKEIIKNFYNHSPALEQEFTVLTEK